MEIDSQTKRHDHFLAPESMSIHKSRYIYIDTVYMYTYRGHTMCKDARKSACEKYVVHVGDGSFFLFGSTEASLRAG